VHGTQVYCRIKLNGVDKVFLYIPAFGHVGDIESGTVSEVFRLKQGDSIQVGGCLSANYLITGNTVNTFSGFLVRAEV